MPGLVVAKLCLSENLSGLSGKSSLVAEDKFVAGSYGAGLILGISGFDGFEIISANLLSKLSSLRPSSALSSSMSISSRLAF